MATEFTLIYTAKKHFVIVFTIISVLFFVISILSNYSSATQKAIPPEDIDTEKFWSLIDTAAGHVNQTTKAIESGNSTMALELLAEIHTDLKNINGNVTDLVFSVSKTPP